MCARKLVSKNVDGDSRQPTVLVLARTCESQLERVLQVEPTRGYDGPQTGGYQNPGKSEGKWEEPGPSLSLILTSVN